MVIGCLRLSDLSVICRVTYLQFPIQTCLLFTHADRQGVGMSVTVCLFVCLFVCTVTDFFGVTRCALGSHGAGDSGDSNFEFDFGLLVSKVPQNVLFPALDAGVPPCKI